MDNEQRARELLSEQNFLAAVIAGAVASVLAAAACSLVVSKWPFAYGFGWAGIGIFVGAAVLFLGRGITTRFAAIAVGFTVVGCFLANLFLAVLQAAMRSARSPLEVFQETSLAELATQAFGYVSGIDFVYLAVAIFAAAFLARRPLSRSDRLALGLFEMSD